MQRRALRRTGPFAAATLLVLLAVDPAEGWISSGSAVFALLTVLWAALYGSGRQFVAALVVAAGVLLGPVLLLGGRYGPELPRALAWTGLTLVVGVAVQQLVGQIRSSAAEAARRADALAEREATLRSITQCARAMLASSDARREVCRAAVTVTGASLAYLVEPEGRDHLVSTCASEEGLPPLRLEIGKEPSGAVVAFTSGRPFVVLDALANPTVSSRLVAGQRVESLVFQPVHHHGTPVGVIALAWRTPLVGVPEHTLAALDLLAAEAAVAIERADLLASLRAEARRDTLTGLWNRRAWDERLADEVARARRSGAPLSVALLDLDRFKAYNDRHGHQAGDRLLKEATAAWRSQLRAGDVLARWGGEEFAVLLPGCTIREARLLVERIRRLTPEGQTCSAGIAEWDRREDLDRVLHRADVALYQAKHTGRDRAVAARRGAVEITLDLGDVLSEHRPA